MNLLLLLCITQLSWGRELFSWTSALKRGSGKKFQDKRLEEGNQLSTPNTKTNTNGRIGYGYTRGSQEFIEPQRVNNRAIENENEETATNRSEMSLATALELLKNNDVALSQSGFVQDQPFRRKFLRPELRQTENGRKVAPLNKQERTGYGYTRGSHEFTENKPSNKDLLRQAYSGRTVEPLPHDDEYSYYDEYGEVYQDYDNAGNYQDVGNYDQKNDFYGSIVASDRVTQGEDGPSQDNNNAEENTDNDDEDCGPECRNLLHELEHPKEDDKCPNPGMVIDIWGYCRYIFHEERRDWSWWENLRTYALANGNSWYNSYRPTAYEEGK